MNMTDHPTSLYSEIEQFCKENRYSTDFFFDQYAINEREIRKPFRAYRGRSPISER